jgi:hypothetical protein
MQQGSLPGTGALLECACYLQVGANALEHKQMVRVQHEHKITPVACTRFMHRRKPGGLAPGLTESSQRMSSFADGAPAGVSTKARGASLFVRALTSGTASGDAAGQASGPYMGEPGAAALEPSADLEAAKGVCHCAPLALVGCVPLSSPGTCRPDPGTGAEELLNSL